MVLLKMKETAEAYLKSPVEDAVITVPAHFNDSQRQATMDAGSIAGLHVMRIMNETTSAAITYALHNIDTIISQERNVLVFDLGGGSFDVTLFTIEDGFVEMIATAGDTHLGGQDFNNIMVNHLTKVFKMKHKKDISGNPRALRLLTAACEKAKITLSSNQRATIEIDSLVDDIDFCTTITRERLETLISDLLRSCMVLVEKCLEDAKMEKSRVDEVVLVGGSTRIPKVRELLQELFDGKELCKRINADEAVAYGAAVQAAILSGQYNDDKSMSISTIGVTPLTLSFEASRGAMTVVIPRNTSTWYNGKVALSTDSDGQTNMMIKVYEGESALTKENNLLGEFVLWGIPPEPKGDAKIIVLFDIDANGVLKVSAKDEKSGKKIGVSGKRGRMSEIEIERMGKEAERMRQEERECDKGVEALNRLENYAYEMRSIIKDVKIGDNLVSLEEKKAIEDAVESALKWVKGNANQVAGDDVIAERIKELETLSNAIFARAFISWVRHS